MSLFDTVNPRFMVKWIRYACYGVIIVLLWQFLGDFSFIRVEKGDNSVVGVTGRHVLIVKNFDLPGGEGPERGMLVAFAMRDAAGRAIRRVSRVAGLPGDRVEAGKGFLLVNGKPTRYPASEGRRLFGFVPPGTCLLLNDNPASSFADSRRLGFISMEVVLGRFLVESPF